MNPRTHEEAEFPAPGERALTAMAEAVRRAREATQGSGARAPGAADVGASGRRASEPGAGDLPAGSRVDVSRTVTTTLTERRDPPVPDRTPSHPPARRPSERAPSGPPGRRIVPRAEKVLRASVIVVGAVIVILSSALVTLQLSGHTSSRLASVQGGEARHHSSPGTKGRASSGRSASSPAAPPAAPPAVTQPGGEQQLSQASPAPELVSVSPTSGGSGQVVTVSGLNLSSRDGIVQARFGGAAVATRCPTQASCIVTVPALPGPPRSLILTIETDAGTSNAIVFWFE